MGLSARTWQGPGCDHGLGGGVGKIPGGEDVKVAIDQGRDGHPHGSLKYGRRMEETVGQEGKSSASDQQTDRRQPPRGTTGEWLAFE